MAVDTRVIACTSIDIWNQHFEKARKEKKFVLVDFTASWCGPCRAIAPQFTELSKKYTDVVFLKVDVDELGEVAQKWDVRAMPTFILFLEEKVKAEFSGASKEHLEKLLTDNCTNKDAPVTTVDA